LVAVVRKAKSITSLQVASRRGFTTAVAVGAVGIAARSDPFLGRQFEAHPGRVGVLAEQHEHFATHLVNRRLISERMLLDTAG
jgi:hypothetical protein